MISLEPRCADSLDQTRCPLMQRERLCDSPIGLRSGMFSGIVNLTVRAPRRT